MQQHIAGMLSKSPTNNRLVLQAAEVPGRLANNTWNCSVPSWPRFRRHFLCDLRQDCAGGEDEVQCPYSPCNKQGGVRLRGHCYFFIELFTRLTWQQGQDECRKVGADLASLTSRREWIDVMYWLQLGVPWLLKRTRKAIYLGAVRAPPSMPHM